MKLNNVASGKSAYPTAHTIRAMLAHYS